MQSPTPPRQTLWRQEAGHLGRSGVTLAFNQLLQIAIPFITTSMTGRLGVDELACGSLVGSIALSCSSPRSGCCKASFHWQAPALAPATTRQRLALSVVSW